MYVRDKVGPPLGPLSVWHSQADNDLDLLASDYEDAGYTDTLGDLAQPTDEVRQYFDLDVTDWVKADYAADNSNPMSAFRLQMDEAVFDEDDVSHNWWVLTGGSFPPELRLNLIPEPSALILTTLSMLSLVAYRRRRR